VPHRIELHLTPTDPTVLERVVTTCRARRCRITSLRFDAVGDHDVAVLSVQAEPRRAALLVGRLDGLIGVLGVRSSVTAPDASAGPVASRPPAPSASSSR
jgi:acetolactate synthase regulatory subunit